MRVRALNHLGIKQFEEYIADLRGGRAAPVPRDLLEDEGASRAIESDASVEDRVFESRGEAAQYFAEQLAEVSPASRDQDRGLWSWLSLFYFDQLCPPRAQGLRKVNEAYRYVPSTDYRHYYRHLLLGPYRIYSTCMPYGQSMLCTKFGSHSDFAEQVPARQELLVNPGFLELLDRLYFDRHMERNKPGATNRKRGGTLRRLIALVNQLELTYDLYTLSADELNAMLPAEFERWQGR